MRRKSLVCHFVGMTRIFWRRYNLLESASHLSGNLPGWVDDCFLAGNEPYSQQKRNLTFRPHKRCLLSHALQSPRKVEEIFGSVSAQNIVVFESNAALKRF